MEDREFTKTTGLLDYCLEALQNTIEEHGAIPQVVEMKESIESYYEEVLGIRIMECD